MSLPRFGLWNSPEYNRLKELTNGLRVAVQDNIISLSSDLLSENMITAGMHTKLINTSVDAGTRAAELVMAVQNKVWCSPKDYVTFLNILKRNKAFYEDIIRELERPLPPTPWYVHQKQYWSGAAIDTWNNLRTCNSPRLMFYSFILTILIYILYTTYPILFNSLVTILVLIIVLVVFC